MIHTLKRSLSRADGIMLGFLAACLFGYLCKVAAHIVLPFVFALFLWYLINAIARLLEGVRLPGKRRLPGSLCRGLGVAALLLLIFAIYKLVHQNIDDVVREAPKFQESFREIGRQAAALLRIDSVPAVQEFFYGAVVNHIDVGALVRAFAAMLTDIAGKIVIILFFIGFLLYEQKFFHRKVKWMFPEKEGYDRVQKVLRTIDVKVQKYIGVKSLVSFLDSFLTFVILSSFSVNFAGFWGVMAFFLHFIPYAGSFLALLMPVLVAVVQFGELTTALQVLAVLSISHAFLGHVLDPYLMGNNLNLSPIFIITNLAMWGMIWGIPGMFLAIPILASIVITLSQFPTTRPFAILMTKTGKID